MIQQSANLHRHDEDFLSELNARVGGNGVRLSGLNVATSMPAVLEPTSSELDPVAWAAAGRDFIENLLHRRGAILFRGFGLKTASDFEAFAEAMSPGLYGQYGDLPRKEDGRNIYRSTPYPEQRMILFHNESSHLSSWPRRQWFFCELPSRSGGATPLVDTREMVRRLPQELVTKFEEKSLLYIRTFSEELDVSWRDFFKTDDREAVKARCLAAGVQLDWLDDEVLQTRTLCQAIVRHPSTNERVFFNQVQLHHPSSLGEGMRQDLIEIVGSDRLPRNVLYGDGTQIDDQTMALIGQLYEACAIRFSWQQGDVVMLDNMLTAHARDPFEGPRKIVVAMGHMMSRDELLSVARPCTLPM